MTHHQNNLQPPQSTIESPTHVVAAGILIFFCAIVSIIAVAMDVTADGNDANSIMQSMVNIQARHQAVHIVAMLCLGGLSYGYYVFSQLLGVKRPAILVGLMAYGFGAILMFLATIIDGFISTDIAALFLGGSAESIKAGFWIIQVAGNVVLIDIAKIAWVAQSVAVVSWAIGLIRERGFQRAIGALGLIVGALPAVAVFVTGNAMTGDVVVGILILQAIWNIAAAVLLIRSGIRSKHQLKLADVNPKTAAFN